MSHPKVDLKKTLEGYRAGRNHVFRVLTVPPTRYLMVDGHGDPNGGEEYAAALAALYPAAYAVKFRSKTELGRDYVVMPLEGLWWADDMAAFTDRRDKAEWDWTMMTMVPEWVTPELVEAVVTAGAAGSAGGGGRGGPAVRVGPAVRMGELDEGLCVQTLHTGSYDDETGILATLHDEFIPESGLTMTGRHHEIYLSDPRRVAPEKLRTILRQPVIRTPRTT